jgi:CRISPR/Cas system-associated exonuclease Cas4 (RecB family)
MFNDYLFRASAIGNLMTESRTKGDLSQTTKSFLRDIWLEEVYGVRKEISSKYLTKGIECEEKSISLYSEVKQEFLTKNETLFKNDFVKGTPDLVTDRIIDVKTPWDIFTFFDADLTKNYYWQLMGYLWLTRKTTGTIAYCLVTTPYHLFEQEEKKIYYNNDCNYDSPQYIAEVENLKKAHIVDYIPASKRVKTFDVEFKQEEIDKLCQRIEEARKYLNNLDL